MNKLFELKEVFNSSKVPFVYNDSMQLLNKIKNDGHFFGLLSGNIKTALLEERQFNSYPRNNITDNDFIIYIKG